MNALERLKELEAKATPGPWESVDFGVHSERVAIAGRGFLVNDEVDSVYCHQSDADLIAEMRNALPKLLAVVEAADILATHVSGVLELGAIGTPETTKGWLENYLKARAELK